MLLKAITFTFLLALPVIAQDTARRIVADQTILSMADDFKTDINAVPCDNKARLDGVKSLFAKHGASADAIRVAAYDKTENLVVKLPGKSDEMIVIGAHYDVAGEGSCGAIDNWTGIVTLAHLYRTLKAVPQLDKTLLFVAFGAEEKGLVGSRAMADAINKNKHNEQYCAMVNLDSLGLAAPQVFENVSNKKLAALAWEAADEQHLPLRRMTIEGADADSTAFLKRKIPALSLVGMPSNWQSYLHTANDQAKHVNLTNVYHGYRVALALIAKINDQSCSAFR
jgi:putative aminopeptidase FrvX